MPEYAFPLLNKQELISTLGELDIQVTNDDLLNPAGWKVKQVYEQLVELMLCMRREDIQQGPFEALEELEHRELHDESVPMIGFLRATNKLLSISGITAQPRTTTQPCSRKTGMCSSRTSQEHRSALISTDDSARSQTASKA